MRSYQSPCPIANRRPQAQAMIYGSERYRDIRGTVRFYSTDNSVIIRAEIYGLPKGRDCHSPVFGFHIHSGTECSGNRTDPFANAGVHYNPGNCPHPYHAGDMPPLFGANGNAFLMFETDRFAVSEVIGKAIIIHAMPDDFTTQPSGNSGAKIACGIIKPYVR